MKLLLAVLAIASATTLYKELQGFSENVKVVLFGDPDWMGDELLPSNDEHLDACEDLESAHPEVTCIYVDAKNDDTVWPVMKDSHLLKDNLPALMVHQASKGKWFYGPQAIDMATDLVEASI